MLIRRLQDIRRTDRNVTSQNWESARLLLKKEGMGFSAHVTTIYAGTETHMWYQNHLESVYCMRGVGEIEDLATGEKHAITVGTLYALDKHDKHILRCEEEMELFCVFNPPLNGKETHNADGAYALDGEDVSA